MTQSAQGPERGSALVLAILVIVIMMLLGLAFMLTGETESKIARNQRDATQAGFIAEGGVRMVKKWFDAPTGPRAHLVPTTADVDRSLRGVDPEGDGTYLAYTNYSSGPYSDWGVQYRQVTNDLFEKPYRGSPALGFMGDEDHPDLRISEGGSSGEQAFLVSMNASLYPSFPMPNERARVRQIDIYSPPIILVGGQRTRYGIATVKVTADVYQYVGTGNETRIATRIVKAVLNEAPYAPGPGGPLQSCVNINTNGEFAPHWGLVTAVGTMDLVNNMSKVDSSVPFYDRSRIIVRTLNTSGVPTLGVAPDDQDANGTADFDAWLNSGNVTDPWLKFWSEGDVLSGGGALSATLCTGNQPDCQPIPFYQPPSTFGTGGGDHSNIFKHVSVGTCPEFPYQFWKNLALSGAENVYYYKSDGTGNGRYKLFGQGNTTTTVRAALDGKSGFFFFDTRDNSEPVDTNADGTYDNLEAPESWQGGGIAVAGFVYLNANLETQGSGNVTSTFNTLIPPGEPYFDANGNNRYDSDEWFVDLDYPGSPSGSYRQIGMHRNSDGGIQRQDPSTDGSVVWANQDINVNGVLYTNGTFDAQGNWTFFGSVITKSGMRSGAGTPDLYFDERLIKDQWPPVEFGLPRTVITTWQTEM